MKKTISVFLSFCLILTTLITGAVTAFAEGNVLEGTDITWNFNTETNELHFEGEGAIPDFNHPIVDGDEVIEYPWKDCAYTSIVFGEGITGIGNYAFANSKTLENIVIPDTVTLLGKGVFLGCTNLESAVLPSEPTEIGESMFSNCESLKSVTFGAKTEKIGKEAFYGCSALESVEFPATLKEIGEAAFHSSALKAITLPEGFEAIGERAFYACEEVESVTLPSTLSTIGKWAFESCRSLTEITFPASVTAIPESVCTGCQSLEKVTLPESITSIGAYAFYGCPSLKEITIPSATTTIGEKAIGYGRWGSKVSGFTITGCANSEPILSYAKAHGFDYNPVGYITSGTCGENATWEYNEEEKTLYINGSGAMADYDADDFVAYNLIPYENVVIAPEITRIGSYAFYNAAAMDFNLSENVAEIGEKAIGYYDNEGAPALREGTSITGYDGLAPMVYAAENNITFNSLGEFIVTEGKLGEDITWVYDVDTKVLTVSGIGETYDYTFESLPEFADYDIESITVSDGITVLGDYAFCTTIAYSSITLGKDIEEIGEKAFGYIKTNLSDEEGNPTDEFDAVVNEFAVVKGYISTPADDYALRKGINFEALDGDLLPLFSLAVDSVIDHIKSIIIIHKNNPDENAIAEAFPVESFVEVIFPEVFGTGNELTLVNENGTYTYKIVVKGDNTGDGEINSSDALAVLQHSVESAVMEDECVLNASDLNNDGAVNSSDALAILQIAVGSRTDNADYNPGIIR